MLIITNGSSAVATMERAGIGGEKLPWEDVLHDGPIPAGLDLEALSTVRARFIADRGWGAFDEIRSDFRRRDGRLRASHDDDEVVLWFEHDLYDQLQLIQLLDWFGAPVRRPQRLSLICHARFVSLLSDEELRRDFEGRKTVTDEQLALAIDAWGAVRAPTPEAVIAILNAETNPLPFLRGALLRFLEELPARDGLARSERQLLAAIADGASTIGEAFQRAQEFENPIYLGDASFLQYTHRLARGPVPLLQSEGEALALTDVGRAVLENREDRIRINGMHRWWGGVRLTGENLWRWDPDRQALRSPKRQAE
ncbi:MAG: hypothetical protein OEY20_02580 [Gemmatimonadota bacterium]|nr:hypothetical protein [Gemmatimonadota bacterium]MDH4349585.1 hypothetical protein [Gemmatimonadota bacterium]MDH5196121.1 hypothetical protein [Gemmatimonadota bacterium]